MVYKASDVQEFVDIRDNKVYLYRKSGDAGSPRSHVYSFWHADVIKSALTASNKKEEMFSLLPSQG